MDALSAVDVELVRADNPGPFTLEGSNSWLVGRDRCWVVDPGPDSDSHLDLLAQLPQPLPFPLFCALLLVAPGWAFWRERGLTQQHDAEQAGLFIRELGVQPVAAGMPQRP